jgi:hypothetical protein
MSVVGEVSRPQSSLVGCVTGQVYVKVRGKLPWQLLLNSRNTGRTYMRRYKPASESVVYDVHKVRHERVG